MKPLLAVVVVVFGIGAVLATNQDVENSHNEYFLEFLADNDVNVLPKKCEEHCIDANRHCDPAYDHLKPKGKWHTLHSDLNCTDAKWAVRCQRSCGECVPCNYTQTDILEEVIKVLSGQIVELEKKCEEQAEDFEDSQDAQDEAHKEEIEDLQEQLDLIVANNADVLEIISHITCEEDDHCENGGSCQDSGACKCAAGWKGSFCTGNVDECDLDSDICGSKGTCKDTIGSYTCTCNTGYENKNGVSSGVCVDTNECTKGTHDCGSNSKCSNTVGSFTCACSNTCTHRAPNNDGRNCVLRYSLSSWSYGDCSCTCGAGTKSMSRKCYYYTGTYGSCSQTYSTTNNNNPCNNAQTSSSTSCVDKWCQITWLRTTTKSSWSWSGSDNAMWVRSFDYNSKDCWLWVAGTFEWWYTDNFSLSTYCTNLCHKRGYSHLLWYMQVHAVGSDGWMMDWMWIWYNNYDMNQFYNPGWWVETDGPTWQRYWRNN